MDSGFYAACTGLAAQTQALDVIAENLANTSTAAYKARQATFQTLLAQNQLAPGSVLNQAVNNYSILGATPQNWQQGNLERTGNELDLALEGQGLFAVQTASGIRYTRDGNFKVSSTNQLVTANGDPVLGDPVLSRLHQEMYRSAPMERSPSMARWSANSVSRPSIRRILRPRARVITRRPPSRGHRQQRWCDRGCSRVRTSAQCRLPFN